MQGRKHSDETRRKMSEARRNRPPLSDEHRAAASERMKRLWDDPDYRSMQSESHKGQQLRLGSRASPETLQKLRDSHTGLSRSLESRQKQSRSISGANHYNWQGGPLPDNYRGEGWHVIKRTVRERAGGRCEFCGGENVRGWQLDVHHIVPYREIPVSAEWACLALCRRCHVRADRGVISTKDLQDALRPRLEAVLR